MNQKVILEFCDVTFSYHNGDKVLDGITFEIREQEIVVILGMSGRGKSTLLKLTNRLLESSSGVIRYLDQDIKSIFPLQLRRQIGYLSQIPCLIEGTVKDNLLLPFYQRGIPENINQRINQILSEVGLNEKYLFRSSLELSVGEKQRVSLARTLINQSKVLLLDEPSSALDEENINILIQSLKRIVREKSVSLVIVTHQLDFAKKLGDRFLVLKDGKVKEIDDPKLSFVREET